MVQLAAGAGTGSRTAWTLGSCCDTLGVPLQAGQAHVGEGMAFWVGMGCRARKRGRRSASTCRTPADAAGTHLPSVEWASRRTASTRSDRTVLAADSSRLLWTLSLTSRPSPLYRPAPPHTAPSPETADHHLSTRRQELHRRFAHPPERMQAALPVLATVRPAICSLTSKRVSWTTFIMTKSVNR